MRPVSVSAIALALVLGAGLAPGRPSDEGGAAFEFVCPCGSEAEFWGGLRERHGIVGSEIPFSELRIFEQNGSFHLDLVATDGSLRALNDSSCRTLFDTALVIVASATSALSKLPESPPVGADGGELQPPELTAPPTAAASPGEEPEPASAPPTPLSVPNSAPPASVSEGPVEKDPPQEAQPRQPALRPRAMISLGGGLSLAFHPSVAYFAEGSVGARVGRFGATLLGRYFPGTQSAVSGDIGLRLESATGRVALVYFPRRWLRLELGPSATWIQGRALGIARPSQAEVWMIAPELEVAALPIRWSGLALEAGLRGWITLNSPRFELDSGGEVFQVPRAGFAIFLHGNWQSR
jgi:hypothetical protein